MGREVAQLEDPVSEGTIRLRSAVRTTMSPGTWFVILFQVLLLLAMNWTGQSEIPEQTRAMVQILVFALLFFALFLASGLFNAMAAHSNVVTVREVLVYGVKVYNRFLWLVVKAVGLVFAAFFVLSALFLGGMDKETQKQVLQNSPVILGLVSVAVNVVFVYWLPLVFKKQHFKLFDTLGRAWQVLVSRWRQTGFVLLLLLVPAAIMLLLPEKPPMPALTLVSVLGQVLGWVVYAYGVEVLNQSPLWLKPFSHDKKGPWS